jgi:RNA 2',3'-cyclic 3'-phosphodiesterase
VRLFAAVEIDETVRQRAAEIIDSARPLLDSAVAVRWVPHENLHLTLWFFGETAEQRAGRLMEVIDRPFAIDPFDLHIAGCGAFPPSGLPRVLWMGIVDGHASVAALHHELARRVRPLGIEPERRPFSAHLTLGRIKEVRGALRAREIRRLWSDRDGDAGVCRVGSVTLFRSRLSPKGSVYEPLLRVPLR